jgi:hypothetical protein
MSAPQWFDFNWHNRGIGVGLMIALWECTFGDDLVGYLQRQTLCVTAHLLICTIELNIPLWKIR